MFAVIYTATRGEGRSRFWVRKWVDSSSQNGVAKIGLNFACAHSQRRARAVGA